MYVANRVANRYTHCMKGKEIEIDGKERRLWIGEEEWNVCMEAGVDGG